MDSKKILVVSIILLFLGVTVASSINFNVVKASNENDFVEVTTHTWGIQGYRDSTMKLTREQYQDLENYLVEFRTQLNQTATREETVLLFKDAIVELHKVGVLPKDIDIDEVQRLVTGRYPMPRLLTHRLFMNRNAQVFTDSNFLCLLTGTTTSTYVIGVPERGVAALIYSLYFPYFLERILSDDPVIMEKILVKLRDLCSSFQRLSSKRIVQAGNIVFGVSKDEYIPPEFRYFPAYGWIDTQGLFGKTSWNGTFFGSIRTLPGFEFRFYSYYIGAIGFVGIKVDKGDGKNFFLGSALYCDVDYFEY